MINRESTKEKLKAVSDLKAGYTLGHADVAILNELARIALASLEAEPVAYMWDSDRKDVDAAGYYRPEHKIFAESSVKRYGGKVVALYAAPPALVANIHPLLEFAREYIESWDLGMAGDSSLLASAKKAIADSSAHQPAPVSVPDERAAFNAWNNDTDCPIAGRDAKTAAWLAWSRRAAMLQAGNSPVIPNGWVMVPVEPTPEMINSAMRDNETGEVSEIYELMIAASPKWEVNQ